MSGKEAYLPYSPKALCPSCYAPLEITVGLDWRGLRSYLCRNCWNSVLEEDEEEPQ